MIYNFKKSEAERLLAHARAAKDHYMCNSQYPKGPGLILVGDQGVYLMSNGKPDLPLHQNVTYAREVNPKELSFEQWWAAKNEGFGGDDSAELIPPPLLEQIFQSEKDGWIQIEVTPMTINAVVRV